MVSKLAELLYDRCDKSIRESVITTWFVLGEHVHLWKMV